MFLNITVSTLFFKHFKMHFSRNSGCRKQFLFPYDRYSEIRSYRTNEEKSNRIKIKSNRIKIQPTYQTELD